MRSLLLLSTFLVLCSAYSQALLPKPQEPISLLRSSTQLAPPTTMTSPWSYKHLGLFCKLDVQLERRTKFPILFRIGDVQQVERWEGKGPLRHY